MISRVRIVTARAATIESSGLFRAGAVACCALVSFVCYFPGRLTPDSTWQLQQALSGQFTDGNPPIMSALWRVLMGNPPGPAPMLGVQVALYWTGVWALWDAAARRDNWRSFATLLPAFHPLGLVLLGVILKDSAMAAALLAGFGILFRQRVLGRPATWISSTFIGLAFAYAALVRWNGVVAVAPLLIYWLAPAWLRSGRIIAATALLSAISFPVSSFVNHVALRAAPAHLEAALEIFDLAGIEYYSGDQRVLLLRSGCYTPFYWDRLNTERCGRLFEQLTGASEFGATDARPGQLSERWLRAVPRHPIAYAEHRLHHFNDSVYFLVPPALVCRNAPEYPACSQPPSKLIVDDFVKKNFLYWPCVWLAAGAWLVFASGAAAGPRALAWSGMLYGLGYLVVGLGTEWRYHFWTVLAISMAVALHFALDRVTGRQFRKLLLFVAPVAFAGYAARLLFLLAG
jgi:hypothetical protein